LFISSNHEGGTVVRIADGVTGFPGNMAVAATDRLEYAYIAAALSARELRAMGINMNLAPVLDVNDNPLNPVIGTRSFGDSPARVAEYGRMAVRGTQDNGVIAVAKHFPGHGSESVDSHGELPVVTEALDVMMQHGLIPFTAAIQEGVAAIMTAHIAIPALDNSGRPATLSPQIVTGLLRERLKFDGLIVTDSLGMGAVSAGRSQPQAAVEAVQAGADIVLSTGPMDAQIGMIRALAAGVQSGQIPIAQIDQSVLRILRVKHAFGLFDASGIDLTVVGLPDHQAVADQIALESVTLLRDNSDYIPIGAPPKRLLVISPDHLPSASSGNGTQFAELLRQHGYEVKELIVNLDSAENRNAVFAQATSQAAAQDVIIFGEWELIKRYVNWADQWQEQLMAALSKSGPPVIVVAWHNPAAILRSPSGAAFLTAYGNTRAQVKAVVDVLIGSAQAAGRLPMTLTTP
jgi:beta-N-acetylhexosaminidase